jgi:hypothetical protein
VKFELIVVNDSVHLWKKDLQGNAMFPDGKHIHFIYVAGSKRKLLEHFVVVLFNEHELQDLVL